MKKYFLAILAMVISANMFANGIFAEKMKVEDGKTVTVDYVLTVDGKEVDSTKNNGPMKYVQGKTSLIPGFTKGVEGMSVGDEKNIVISPEDGYGEVNPEAIRTISRSQLPENIVPEVGRVLEARTPDNRIFPVTIVEVNKDEIVVDYNHPLAGKTLNFDVKVIAIS